MVLICANDPPAEAGFVFLPPFLWRRCGCLFERWRAV